MVKPPYRIKNMMPGMIMLWAGAIVDIPSGWHLCDGTVGTPDLRDRFVVGAGDTYNPGDIGGADDHTHTFTSDGHNHVIEAGPYLEAGDERQALTDTKTDSGTTDPTDHRPKYYALAYIMKLSIS